MTHDDGLVVLGLLIGGFLIACVVCLLTGD